MLVRTLRPWRFARSAWRTAPAGSTSMTRQPGAPFVIARIGEKANHNRAAGLGAHLACRLGADAPLSAAGVDVQAAALAESFSEVHPPPGRDLMPVVDGLRRRGSGHLPDDA